MTFTFEKLPQPRRAVNPATRRKTPTPAARPRYGAPSAVETADGVRMVGTTELYGVVALAMGLGYALLWLCLAGLGLWRIRVAMVPSALLIASGLLGATLQFLSPAVHMAVTARASMASVDTVMLTTLVTSSLLALLGTLPWILLLVALWRLLLGLPRPPEAP